MLPSHPHLKLAFLTPFLAFVVVLFLRPRQWSITPAELMVLTQLRCIKQSVVPAFYLAPGCFYNREGGVGGGWLHFRNTCCIFKFNMTKTTIKEAKGHSLLLPLSIVSNLGLPLATFPQKCDALLVVSL